MEKMVATIEQAIEKMFAPEHAFAQVVTAPFGGAILASFPCDGDIWNVYLEPLPPTYAVALSYVGGSQAFLSYNAPIPGTFLLGEYLPVPFAYCWFGIIPVPTEGMISPELGSSPL